MTTTEHKVLENRLRRSARRQGLRLERSRVRDQRATGYGTYQLVDISTNSRASWGDLPGGYGLDLHDVARYLFEDFTIHVIHIDPDTDPLPAYRDVGENEYAIFYRNSYAPGTPKIRMGDGSWQRFPDGWVLDTRDGDEYVIGGSEDDSEWAVQRAQDYLRSLGYTGSATRKD
jgi:hypothetical protein